MVAGAAAEALGALTGSGHESLAVVQQALSAGIWADRSVLEGAVVGCALAGEPKLARAALLAHRDVQTQPSRRAARALLVSLLNAGAQTGGSPAQGRRPSEDSSQVQLAVGHVLSAIHEARRGVQEKDGAVRWRSRMQAAADEASLGRDAYGDVWDSNGEGEEGSDPLWHASPPGEPDADWVDGPEAGGALDATEARSHAETARVGRRAMSGEGAEWLAVDPLAMGVVVSALVRVQGGSGLSMASRLLGAAVEAVEAEAVARAAASRRREWAAMPFVTDVAQLCGEALQDAAELVALLSPQQRATSAWRRADADGSLLAVAPIDEAESATPSAVAGTHLVAPLPWPVPAGLEGAALSDPEHAAELRADVAQFAASVLSHFVPLATTRDSPGTSSPHSALVGAALLKPSALHLCAALDIAMATDSEWLVASFVLPLLATHQGLRSDPGVVVAVAASLQRWLDTPGRAAAAMEAARALGESGLRVSVKDGIALCRSASVAWVDGMRATAPPAEADILAAGRATHGPQLLDAMVHVHRAADALDAAVSESSGRGHGLAIERGMGCPVCGMAASSPPRQGAQDLPECPSTQLWHAARAGQGNSVLRWALDATSGGQFLDEAAGRGFGQAAAHEPKAQLAPEGQLHGRVFAGTPRFENLRPSEQIRLWGGLIDMDSHAHPTSQARLPPAVLSTLLDASLGVPCAAQAWRILAAMREQGTMPSAPQLAAVRAACALAGNVGKAWEAHLLAQRAGRPASPSWVQRSWRAGAAEAAMDETLALARGAGKPLPSWGAMLHSVPGDLSRFVRDASNAVARRVGASRV